MTRYLRLLGALARYGLARELAFRGNFLAPGPGARVKETGLQERFQRTHPQFHVQYRQPNPRTANPGSGEPKY